MTFEERKIKEKIYEIIDSFLTEAKDQYGNERTLERLNQDRHLAAENLEKLFSTTLKELLDNIGDLRQWLNEDRITEPDKMVSNEDIIKWLK